MTGRSAIPWLGLGIIAFAAFILLIAIPYGINSPANVDIIFLSPKFWPLIIACVVALLGALLVMEHMVARRNNGDAATPDAEETEEVAAERAELTPWLRLAGIGALMAGLILATPVLGMVWTSMVCFILFGVLVRTPRPIATLIVAIVLPLVLYAFFSHVAGVPVPQGDFVRLP